MSRDPMQTATDAELVAMVQRDPGTVDGRQAASELLGRYRAHVYRWCRRYRPEGEDALDLAQEILLTAWRKLPSFGGRSQFSSWLFVLTRNRCLDELRKRPMPTTDVDEIRWLADPADDPARARELKDDERELRERLARQLTPQEQDAVWLRYVEGMSVNEITAALRISGSTGARGVLQGARRKLRAHWPGIDKAGEEPDRE